MTTDAGVVQLTKPSEHEIMVTRNFAAPRSAVFDALTNPAVVTQWLLGPTGWTMPICEIDLRVGGKFRFKWRHTDGSELGMSGVYREVEPPTRLTNTEVFDEDWTGGETLTTVGLAEREGVTTLSQTIRYSSPAARDGALATNMLDGMNASFDRLDKLLRSAES